MAGAKPNSSVYLTFSIDSLLAISVKFV
jgi:hypothetical protein